MRPLFFLAWRLVNGRREFQWDVWCRQGWAYFFRGCRYLEAEMLLKNRIGKFKPSVKVLVIVVSHFIIAISVCSLRPSGFARRMRCLRMLNRCAQQTMLNKKTIWKAHQKTVAARQWPIAVNSCWHGNQNSGARIPLSHRAVHPRTILGAFPLFDSILVRRAPDSLYSRLDLL